MNTLPPLKNLVVASQKNKNVDNFFFLCLKNNLLLYLVIKNNTVFTIFFYTLSISDDGHRKNEVAVEPMNPLIV